MEFNVETTNQTLSNSKTNLTSNRATTSLRRFARNFPNWRWAKKLKLSKWWIRTRWHFTQKLFFFTFHAYPFSMDRWWTVMLRRKKIREMRQEPIMKLNVMTNLATTKPNRSSTTFHVKQSNVQKERCSVLIGAKNAKSTLRLSDSHLTVVESEYILSSFLNLWIQSNN